MEETLKLILSQLEELKEGQDRIESKLDGMQEEYQRTIQDLSNHIDSKLDNIDKATQEKLQRIEYKINRTDDDVISLKSRLSVVK